MLRKPFRPKAIVHWDIIEKETVDTKSGKEQELIFIPQKVADCLKKIGVNPSKWIHLFAFR
jgi:hypothetical protein